MLPLFPILNLDISVLHKKLYPKIHGKRDFALHIVIFPFLDSEVLLTSTYGVSQRDRYARFCIDVFDFNKHNLCIYSKLLNLEFHYHEY